MNRHRTRKPQKINVNTATDEQKDAVVSYAAATADRIAPLINAEQEEIVLAGKEAASLVITMKILYHELDKAITTYNAMCDTMNVVSAHIAAGLAENAEQDHRIRSAIEAVLANGDLADLHKGWALDQVLRILTGCRDAEDSEGYQQAMARYYSATDEQWDEGIEP